MKKVLETNNSLERQLFLAELIQKEFKKDPKTLSISIDLATFNKHVVFTDIEGLKRALAQLKAGLGEDFEYRLLSRGMITSVSDTDLKNLPQVPYAYKIVLEDREALAGHILALKEKLKRHVKSYQFILLQISENKSVLMLVGSDKKSSEMRHAGYPYKVLSYFAERKTKVVMRTASEDLGLLPGKIRKKITEIKTDVHKSFDIPREAIFENDSDNTGYRVANVSIKDR